jgi:DNA-binding winged helix-turn-helix (wHTH) protein
MQSNTSDADLPVVNFGEFRMDFHLRGVYSGPQKIKIGAMPFNALEFLVRNRHRVVSKDELLKNIWGGERTRGTVEQAISQLRRVLRDNSAEPRYIETIPGHGYRFIAHVLIPVTTNAEQDRATSIADVVPDPPADEVSAAVPEITTSRDWVFYLPRRMTAFWLAVALVGCIAAVVVALHFREPQIAGVTANGYTLVAKGTGGNVLWTYRFDAALQDNLSEAWNWRTQIVDLNGDGKPEVLVAAAFVNPQEPNGWDEIFCFSSRGRLLWSYRPEIHMEFNTADLNGPWYVREMIVVDEGPAKSIWVAVAHIVWWPAFVIKISPDGGHETMFTSSGAIFTLLSVRTKLGAYVLAGGVNNEYRMASMAVLAANGPPATSPQSDGAKYQCIRGCPGARPYRYVLLPRSEVNVGSDRPYNWVRAMRTRPGGITVVTDESVTGAGQYFDFSEELQPERVIYSDDYADLHKRYEIEGRIAHSFDLYPERRTPALVRVFDENGGSRLVSVPRVP